MGIDITRNDVKARFDKFLAVIRKRQIQRLQYLGEECVTHARTIPAAQGFTDRTGNLRSSIGYVIFENGVAIHDNFESCTGPDPSGNNSAGAIQKSKKLAESVARRHPTGICLVVTAGMEYAIFVESKGRDVLASAETLATQKIPKMVQELVDNINKAIQ